PTLSTRLPYTTLFRSPRQRRPHPAPARAPRLHANRGAGRESPREARGRRLRSCLRGAGSRPVACPPTGSDRPSQPRPAWTPPTRSPAADPIPVLVEQALACLAPAIHVPGTEDGRLN